jgi:hypothetical protein
MSDTNQSVTHGALTLLKGSKIIFLITNGGQKHPNVFSWMMARPNKVNRNALACLQWSLGGEVSLILKKEKLLVPSHQTAKKLKTKYNHNRTTRSHKIKKKTAKHCVGARSGIQLETSTVL